MAFCDDRCGRADCSRTSTTCLVVIVSYADHYDTAGSGFEPTGSSMSRSTVSIAVSAAASMSMSKDILDAEGREGFVRVSRWLELHHS